MSSPKKAKRALGPRPLLKGYPHFSFHISRAHSLDFTRPRRNHEPLRQRAHRRRQKKDGVTAAGAARSLIRRTHARHSSPMPRSSRGHRLGRALVDAAVVCPEGRPEAAGDAGGLCAVRVVKEEDVVDRRNLPRDSRDLAEIDVGKGLVARSSRELAAS